VRDTLLIGGPRGEVEVGEGAGIQRWKQFVFKERMREAEYNNAHGRGTLVWNVGERATVCRSVVIGETRKVQKL